MKQTFFLVLMLCVWGLMAQKPYFQQEVNYTIQATLDDKVHQLSGSVQMEYINRSPDALSELWMHVWGNAYKNQKTAFAHQQLINGKTKFHFAKAEEMGGYTQLDFSINGEKANWQYDEKNPDIVHITLAKPLQSGEKVTILAPFTLKIPASFSRLGHVGQSYQMTQWYPKPAVYDTKGWHPIPYLDQGEFYSEFGRFDVTLTLPANYVVGATGTLQTESERAFLDKKVKETLDLIEKGPLEKREEPGSSMENKTIRYTAENVHDFAWFADKNFHVVKTIATLPSGKSVDCWGMFANEDRDEWVKGAEYVARAVLFYSANVGDYPYPHATAVQSALSAGGGMEYPMITVIGKAGNAKTLDNVITHEVGHNWFYGILASNERVHGWMDEGMNTFYENRYMKTYYEDRKTEVKGFSLDFDVLSDKISDWFGRAHLDQAPDTHSEDFISLNYGLDMYQKTGRSMKALEEYVGVDTYDRIMKAYFDKWKFRHPYPEDFRKHWEEALPEKNLSWFFDGLIASNQKVNYSFRPISPRNKVGEDLKLKVVHSGLETPLPIAGMKDGKEVTTIWYDFPSDKSKTVITFPKGEYDDIAIDPKGLLPDVYRVGNHILPKGRNPFVFPFKPFNLIENPKKPVVYGLLPITAYNFYNKWQLGGMLYTPLFPTARNGYIYLAPLYSFETDKWNINMGVLSTYYMRKGFVDNLTFDVNLRSFDMDNSELNPSSYSTSYVRSQAQVEVKFRKSRPNAPLSHSARLRRVSVSTYDRMLGIDTTNYFSVNELQYKFENTLVTHPMTATATVQAGRGFAKVFGHYNQRFLLTSKKHLIDIHGFAGTFLVHNNPNGNVAFQVAGGTGSGLNQRDYAYEQLMLARSTRLPGSMGGTWLSQQIYMQDAGLKTQGYTIGSTKWMLGGGIAYRLPLPVGIYPYIDAALYPQTFSGTTKTTAAWSSGVRLTVVKDIFDVYFPIAESKSLTFANRPKYGQRISFSLNLNRLNPYHLLRDLRLNM